MRETGKRFKQALQTKDLNVVGDVADEVLEVLERHADLVDQLEHVGRLVDLGRTTTSLVHELRQPLLGIKAFAQMVEAKSDDDYVQGKARSIQEQSIRMERLIEHVRCYGRAGFDQPLVMSDVNKAVDAALEILSPRIRSSRVTISKTLAEDLPRVMGDGVGFQQILINLVSNAFEATGAGGVVKIETYEHDGSVLVAVTDDGPGIAPSIRSRLFKPFATGKEDGTGLGLFVCKEVASRMGAELRYVETPAGARFELEIPIKP